MNKPNLPEGYFIEEEELNNRKFTYLRNKEGTLVLSMPPEHYSLQRIEEVAQQIEGAKTIKS